MKFINTDGMAFFGPGSEWFWSFLQFVVVGVSLLGVYRQLALARSAKAFDEVSRLKGDWDSEKMSRNRLAIYVAIRDGTNRKPSRRAQRAMSPITGRALLDSLGLAMSM